METSKPGQQRPLLFNPVHSRKQKPRESFPSTLSSNLYTAPFPRQTPPLALSSPNSSIQNSLASTNFNFVNPRPSRMMKVERIDREESRQRVSESSRYEQLERKVKVLRKTVSQNKLIAQNRLQELAKRAERLKEQYRMKDRQLSQLVLDIHKNLP